MRKTGVIFKLSWVAMLALILSLGIGVATDGQEAAAGGESDWKEYKDGVNITGGEQEEGPMVIEEEIEGESGDSFTKKIYENNRSKMKLNRSNDDSSGHINAETGSVEESSNEYENMETISGDVKLPAGETPEGEVEVRIGGYSYEQSGWEFNTTVTIPEGEQEASYELEIPEDYIVSAWALGYDVRGHASGNFKDGFYNSEETKIDRKDATVINIKEDELINRNIELIKNIKEKTNLNLQIMLNESCFRNCPFRKEHFDAAAIGDTTIF